MIGQILGNLSACESLIQMLPQMIAKLKIYFSILITNVALITKVIKLVLPIFELKINWCPHKHTHTKHSHYWTSSQHGQAVNMCLNKNFSSFPFSGHDSYIYILILNKNLR